jgi:hypothetical protein
MKRYLTVVSIALAFPSFVWGTDWDAAYAPTRKEWIEVAIHNDIVKITDLWKARIAVNVVVFKTEDVVAIAITTPNGVAPLSKESCAGYVSTIRTWAQNRLAQFPWAKTARIEVICNQ